MWLRAWSALTVVSVAGLAGCGGSDESDRVGAPRAELVRNCSTRVEGGLPRGWRRRSVEAGPIAFYPARSFESRPNPNPAAKLIDEKTLVVVRAGEDVTVAVGSSERRSASLDYGYGRRRTPPVKLSDGVGAVRFMACRGTERPFSPGHRLDRETQFNGGVVTRWGRCVPLDVFARTGGPVRATISFGAGRCR